MRNCANSGRERNTSTVLPLLRRICTRTISLLLCTVHRFRSKVGFGRSSEKADDQLRAPRSALVTHRDWGVLESRQCHDDTSPGASTSCASLKAWRKASGSVESFTSTYAKRTVSTVLRQNFRGGCV